jgi:SAM-dependent methyltransferase
MTTLEREQQFHDAQAVERAVSFQTGRAMLRFDDAAYLDHETWIRPAFAMLGDLRGKVALDFGCGHGMAAVVMARSGAEAHAFDLSPRYVEETRERANANRVRVNATVANGEELPYDDATFDAIWGCAILHHLDLRKAASELHRVLKPGGVAVFCEPWGGNPILEFTRRWLPYPEKHRTPDECPLNVEGVTKLREVFPTLEFRGFQLFEMLKRAVPNLPGAGLLRVCDERLFRSLPGLQNYSRYAVLNMTKESILPDELTAHEPSTTT